MATSSGPDLKICTRCQPSDVFSNMLPQHRFSCSEAVAILSQGLGWIMDWMGVNKLRLNTGKTEGDNGVHAITSDPAGSENPHLNSSLDSDLREEGIAFLATGGRYQIPIQSNRVVLIPTFSGPLDERLGCDTLMLVFLSTEPSSLRNWSPLFQGLAFPGQPDIRPVLHSFTCGMLLPSHYSTVDAESLAEESDEYNPTEQNWIYKHLRAECRMHQRDASSSRRGWIPDPRLSFLLTNRIFPPDWIEPQVCIRTSSPSLYILLPSRDVWIY
ncbi:Aspartyl/glutamyl-tRNA(Asn/Gln) amidotransferase subunit C [Varanus komodoensis]|nr:Aspartyl/glutamyl-tRNA(Asn/Gln) amidotransferase subunit C [Varanus komodoensis]